jgi:hypothetical protein
VGRTPWLVVKKTLRGGETTQSISGTILLSCEEMLGTKYLTNKEIGHAGTRNSGK